MENQNRGDYFVFDCVTIRDHEPLLLLSPHHNLALENRTSRSDLTVFILRSIDDIVLLLKMMDIG